MTDGKPGTDVPGVRVSALAGNPAPASLLVDVPGLVTAYYTGRPDASCPASA